MTFSKYIKMKNSLEHGDLGDFGGHDLYMKTKASHLGSANSLHDVSKITLVAKALQPLSDGSVEFGIWSY